MKLVHLQSSTTNAYVEQLRNERKHQHVAGTKSESTLWTEGSCFCLYRSCDYLRGLWHNMSANTTAKPLTEYSSFPTRKKCRRSPGMHRGSSSDQWREVLNRKEFGTLNVLLFVLIAFREVRTNSSLRFSSFTEWRRAAKIKIFLGIFRRYSQKQTNKQMDEVLFFMGTRFHRIHSQLFIEM